ncbi:hypothetical protein NPIL_486081 [Nephila pilipes]|uniref:Uncharacterized protein n=1 Tax=Nephila pilipes TaxID=299642 RepID=A0A8X6MLS4_NEPPI|nr:hypothetical protein NPIL_486081 [Nephila pilipes]
MSLHLFSRQIVKQYTVSHNSDASRQLCEKFRLSVRKIFMLQIGRGVVIDCKEKSSLQYIPDDEENGAG